MSLQDWRHLTLAHDLAAFYTQLYAWEECERESQEKGPLSLIQVRVKCCPFLGLPLTQKLKRTPCPSAPFSLSLSLSLSHTYIQIHCSSTSFLFSLSLSLTQLPLVLFLIQIFLAEWRHWCDQYLLGKRSRLVFVESRRVCLVGVDQ